MPAAEDRVDAMLPCGVHNGVWVWGGCCRDEVERAVGKFAGAGRRKLLPKELVSKLAYGSKMAIQSTGSNLARTMEPSMISKSVGICIETRSILPFAPETSGVELVAPFLDTIPHTPQ